MLNAPLPSYLGALSDPLRAMLLWFAALNQDPPRELCRLLGLTDLDLATVERAYGPTLGMLRQLQTVTQLCQSKAFGALLLARAQEMTLCATSPEQVQRLCQAAARLPLWIRDPKLDALERELRHEECAVRMLELRARRSAIAPATPTETSHFEVAPGSVPETTQIAVAPAAAPESTTRSAAGSARQSLASESPSSSPAPSARHDSESPSSSAAPSARPSAADTASHDSSAATETGPNEAKNAKSQGISAPQVKSAPSRQRTAGVRKPSRAARKAANTGRVTSGRP